MVHFAIHSPRSPYGVPRWIGSLLSVDGAGGSGDSTKTKIELKSLTDAQQQDALFQAYDERNIDKVGASFRVPRPLRGESKDFNRAVADAQLRFAEDQVFQPERAEFDHFMNHRLFPAMGIRMWRFRSKAPITRDPERLTDSIERLVRVGVVTPEEGRALAADVFNRDFRAIGDDWVKRPITLTLAGVQTGVADVSQPIAKSPLSARARDLSALRNELLRQEKALADKRMASIRDQSRVS